MCDRLPAYLSTRAFKKEAREEMALLHRLAVRLAATPNVNRRDAR